MEDRIIRLEETVALQEKTIEDLSDVLAAQQKQLDAVERLLQAVATRLQTAFTVGATTAAPPDEAPPHY
ncbi:SlyX family protein [Desulfocurvus sp.]|jgi:SlyX protein|uniref:SlyX family protein n=1 Tax=Desulfocurvus sp. TaxID=2871698 RepID=UPI0025B8B581|nr:SlyX family protein [Desulfocurvus sp.]MCK9241127.1 SlyX family protein [Desulfocurvus sp.]